MATSPNFDTSNQYIKYRIVVTENSTSIADNTSNVTVQVQVWRTNTGYTTYGSGDCYCTINGNNYSQEITPDQEFTYNSYTQVFSQTVNIPHNADGSKTIYVSSYISHNRFSSSSQGFNVTLTKIPRYATSNQSLSSKTETTIRMNWSSDSTIDYIEYSTNNGSSWAAVGSVNSTSGSYTINNLAANTTYNIKTRVRRKDSQLKTESSNLAVATYNYPYASSMPNFTIGNTLTIGLYNPLNRSMTVQIIGNDNSTVDTWTGTGTSITGYTGATTIDNLYKSIPNSNSGTYKVRVTYGSSAITKTGGTYSVNVNNVKPAISNVTYKDNNSTTVAITQNNQQIIRNNSDLFFTFGTLTANKYATLSKVQVTLNGVTKNKNLTGTTASNTTLDYGTVNISSNATATITLTDSRGNTASTTKNITILDWVLPTANITLNRKNNYYSETYITVNATFSSIDSKNTLLIQYQYKKVTDTTYSALEELTNYQQTEFTVDNLYQWDIRVILTDRLGSTTYNLFLDKGMPITYYDRRLSSTGFNCFPQYERSVEIDGSQNTRYCGRAIASAVSVSSLTFTTITFDTFNLKSERTIIEQNNIIKVLKDGIYKISFNARWADISSGSNNCCVGISINGSTADNPEQTIWQTNSKRLTANGTILRQLNANDTIQPLLYTENATTLNEIIMWVESLNIEGGD